MARVDDNLEFRSLPPGWCRERLGDVVEFTRRPRNLDTPNQVAFLPMALIPEGGGATRSFERRSSTKGGTYFEQGDFLLARITPCFENGKQAIAADVPGGWGLATSEVYAMRSNLLSPQYIDLLFKSPAIRRKLIARMEGATGRMRLPRAAVEDLIVPVAPPEEQLELTAEIEALFSSIQAGEGAFRAATTLVEEYERSVLVAGVTGRLSDTIGDGRELLDEILSTRDKHAAAIGTKATEPLSPSPIHGIEIPPGWTWASIDQLALKIQYGSSAKASDDASGVPVLRMGNLQGGRIIWDHLKYLPPDHPDLQALRLEQGDLLFNRTNSVELVGKTALMSDLPGITSFASYLIRIVPHPAIEPAWISYWLNSLFGRRWAREQASQQAGQANISASKLRVLAIPLPTAETQHAIVRELDVRLAEAHATTEHLESSLTGSEALRQSIVTTGLAGGLARQTGVSADANFEGCAA